MSATATESPLTMLLAQLDNIANGRIAGCSVTTTKTGNRTVQSPGGQIRIPNPDTLTDETAAVQLQRLVDRGVVRTAGKRTKARRGLTVVGEATADETPVYAGDPPVSAGRVRREVLLTPVLAQELLDRPWEAITSDGRSLRQRPIDPDTVNDIAELLLTEKFRELHPQGLQVGLNGSFYNGRHRATAVIKTGRSVWVYVEYNVHPDDFEVTDSGRERRSQTKLFMEGYDHSPTLSAAARLIFSYGDYEAAIELGSPANQMPWERWKNIKLSHQKVQAVVHENPGLYEWLLWAASAPQVRPRLNVSSIAAFAYVADRAWPVDEGRLRRDGKGTKDKLHEFLDAVVSNIGIHSADHVGLLINQWLSLHGPAYTRCVKEAHFQLLLWAWREANVTRQARKAVPKTLPQKLVLPYRP